MSSVYPMVVIGIALGVLVGINGGGMSDLIGFAALIVGAYFVGYEEGKEK